jgi:hypothetical protein
MSWHDLFPLLAIVLSVIALSVSLWDWKSKLALKARKGSTYNPYRLKKATDGSLAFLGAVEVYNMSSRANAIRDYSFWRKDESGEWIAMESQNYQESSADRVDRNKTSVTLAPYSGVEIKVVAFARMLQQPIELKVRIRLKDLFGNHYQIEVNAESD